MKLLLINSTNSASEFVKMKAKTAAEPRVPSLSGFIAASQLFKSHNCYCLLFNVIVLFGISISIAFGLSSRSYEWHNYTRAL